MLKTIHLIRERQSENEIFVDTFQTERDLDKREILKALRMIVKGWLETEDGKKAIDSTSHDFNWGDAIIFIPYSVWEKFGFKLLDDVNSLSITVNQDEVLCEKKNEDY